jgi:hypothetical protein
MRRLGIAALCASTACYHYAPMEPSAIQTGAAVRLDLSSAGSTRMTPILGAGTNSVEGTILAATDTGYRMSVSGTHKATTGAVRWSGEQVTVPRDAIERVQTRSLDRKRTLGVAALAILAGVALKVIFNAFDPVSGGDEDGGGGVTPP